MGLGFNSGGIQWVNTSRVHGTGLPETTCLPVSENTMTLDTHFCHDSLCWSFMDSYFDIMLSCCACVLLLWCSSCFLVSITILSVSFVLCWSFVLVFPLYRSWCLLNMFSSFFCLKHFGVLSCLASASHASASQIHSVWFITFIPIVQRVIILNYLYATSQKFV